MTLADSQSISREEDSRKEEDLDGNSQARMQRHNQDQEDLARLRIRSVHDGVKIPQKEEDSPRKPNTNKRPVKRGQRTPAHKRNTNPDQVGVPIQSPALNQISSRAPEPAQSSPQRNGQDTRVPIDQARRPRQQSEIVREMLVVVVCQPLRNGTGQEEDYHDRAGDPDGAVQVRIAFQYVEEVRARVQCRHAAAEHLVCVDIEVPLVVV